MRRIVALVCTAPLCDYRVLPARFPLAHPERCPLCGRDSIGSELWAAEHHKPMRSLTSVLDAIRDAFAAEGLAF